MTRYDRDGNLVIMSVLRLSYQLALLWTAVLALGGCAVADRAPASPKPVAGQVRELDYFTGTWLASAVDPATGVEIRVRYTVRPSLGGKWYVGAAQGLSTPDASQDVWGKDPLTSEIVRTIFDASGVYAVVRSKGWSGDTLVLQGEGWTPKGAVQVRETITRVTRDEFKAVWEALRDGKWVPYSVEKVTREAT